MKYFSRVQKPGFRYCSWYTYFLRQSSLIKMVIKESAILGLIFPLRLACFPIKIGRNAQWEHLFSVYFDDFV